MAHTCSGLIASTRASRAPTRRMNTLRAPARPMRVPRAASSSQGADSSLPDDLSFTAADAAFLRAMAMRPQLPTANIGWDDAVGDHSCIDGWHAQAWQMWGQAAAAPAQPPPTVPEQGHE